MNEYIPRDILYKLKGIFMQFMESDVYEEIVGSRESILDRYKQVFSPEHIPEITEEEFKSFLDFKNNKHWSGLHRQGNKICSDMDLLKKTLLVLVDEEQPIEIRLDATSKVLGLGRAIATAILHISQPDVYGVWNGKSEDGLKELRIWPEFERGESEGEKYVKINLVLNMLKDALETDLWALDSLWWYLNEEGIDVSAIEKEPVLNGIGAIVDLLDRKKQIILYGPPGTGKTFSTKKISLETIHG